MSFCSKCNKPITIEETWRTDACGDDLCQICHDKIIKPEIKLQNYELPAKQYYEIYECLKICKTLVPIDTEIYQRLSKIVY